MKMLPFDNKSEFQVVVDMPEGTALEETGRVLDELAASIAALPEVTDYQIYAGTSAPINFNGLVRQYYLRSGPELGDIQVNLVDKHHRDQKSHEIAIAARPALAEIGRKHGAAVKVVEVPPGPPVQAPLVAEIYGPFRSAQRDLTREVRAVFEATPGVVDVDDSLEAESPRLVVRIDRQKAALLGVSQAEAVQVLAAGLGGYDATFVGTQSETNPIPVRLELGVPDKADLASILALQVRARSGARVPLSELTVVEERSWDQAIYHKDLLPMTWVTADAVGELDSPLYGMFKIVGALPDALPPGTQLEQRFFSPPEDPYRFSLKWDGEWQITFETFRDMGLAYSVGLILIYLLVVAQFRSYAVPLVIMAPIPLTVIGVMPGHALLGAQFTATSMIGMIALAGIIVRNSILLVDFVNVEIERGAQAGRRGDRRRRRAGPPDRADCGGRDDRRVLHPRRPDLQRARGVVDLRHPGLHGADARADPDPLLQLSQQESRRSRAALRGNHGQSRRDGCGSRWRRVRLRDEEEARQCARGDAGRHQRLLRVHAVESLDHGGLAHRAADPRRPREAAGRQGHQVGAEDGERDRRGGRVADARRRLEARLRPARDRDGPEARVRGGARPRAQGLHAVGVHARARARGLGPVPEVRPGRRARSWSARRRARAASARPTRPR